MLVWVFELDSWTLLLVLFAMLSLSAELGHRVGLRAMSIHDSAAKEQIGTFQAGVLATVGLILGFAFAVSVARFDGRRQLIVDEAAAIGTAYLRTQLLSEPESSRAASLFSRYVDVRIAFYDARADKERLARAVRMTEQLQRELWEYAAEAAHKAPNDITALFAQALNEMFDLAANRLAAMSSHVPVLVVMIVLLFSALGMGTLASASTARCGKRLNIWFVLAVLLSSLVLMIVDLDRPRRGLIPVNHDAMLYLRESFR